MQYSLIKIFALLQEDYMRRILNLFIIPIIAILLIFSGCKKSSSRNNFPFFGLENQLDKEAPSDNSVGSNDALSSSTNYSSKIDDPRAKAKGTASTSYIKPPQINNYGTVNLGYPVEIPSGRAGLMPQVGLSYSSTGGDGLVGIGWNLGTGLGVISRTTRHGQICYDQRDIFTFNGKRLVKVDGPSDSENGTYRLEIESGFSRFELKDVQSGGVWNVYDKSGAITIFGKDRSSRIYHPDDINKTYTWQFSRSTDLNGNYMYALYDTSEYDENHILYLKEIRYTGNEAQGMDANQYVRFHLKNREESYVSKAPGFIMKMDKLLDIIEVGWDDPDGSDDTELWRYEMVYEISDDSNRPVLKTVQSTRTTTQPEFIYQPAVHHFTWKRVYNPHYNDPEMNYDITKYFEGDFTGDGISDMVFFNPETGYWKAAQGRRDGGYSFPVYGYGFKGYDNPSKIQWFKGNVTGDYNGDGKSDIAFYLPETRQFYVAEHNGKVFNFRVYGRLDILDIDIFKCEWFTGDYDANGLSDALLFNEPTGEWILMRNMGGSFKFQKFSTRFKNLFRDDYSPDMNMDSQFTKDDSEHGRARDKVHFLSGDYNGDNRTDISIYDERDGRWWVAENYMKEQSPYSHGDVDFRLEWKLYKRFTAWEMAFFVPKDPLYGNDRFSGDFNGDGYSDFLMFDRDDKEWIIGETGNGTINFRKYSEMPKGIGDITRWLQGDFNGDGRTDVGFYSRDDNNFWIGEAVPDGFRYRIYSRLGYGLSPDPDRVMLPPAPEDEAKIADDRAVAASDSATAVVDYQYDDNYHSNRGEKPFVGFFKPNEPGLLVFDRKDDKFYYYSKADGDTNSVDKEDTGINNITGDIHFLNKGRTVKYRNAYDSILYYEKQNSNHSFWHIYHDGSFKLETIASFSTDGGDGADLFNFNFDESIYFTDSFRPDVNGVKFLLVLDDQSEAPDFIPKFKLFDNSAAVNDVIIDETGDLPSAYFQDLRGRRDQLQFFTGNFKNLDRAQILMVDMSEPDHKWYLGVITDNGTSEYSITFSLLSGDYNFSPSTYPGHYRVIDGSVIYGSLSFNRAQFNKIVISEDNSVTFEEYSPLHERYRFNHEYDHNGNPVVHYNSQVYIVPLDSEAPTPELPVPLFEIVNLKRDKIKDDLYDKAYPFEWIQGDYNGDNKTDIGIFHLKERAWYFANTEGTVPDLISRVKNGIGGSYEMEYINSTTLDNTGDDKISDLPINYKVCSKLTVSDGFTNNVITYYEYSGGYAFSSFINGLKETDYFGFSEFMARDSLGGRSISYYHNVPYDDFRKNRALAGAIKESRFIGCDNVEYNRTTYEYKMHEITTPSPPAPLPQGEGRSVFSYLVETVEVRSYRHNSKTGKPVLVKTAGSNIVLTPGKYEMESKTESVTDHYSDSVHSATTMKSYQEFENIESSNEMRLVLKKNLVGTSYETSATYEYDNNGNLTQETVGYTGSGLDPVADRVLTYEYDGFGNRIRSINNSDSPSRISEVDYDAILQQFVTEQRTVINDDDYLSTIYTINYESAFGQPSIITDANGNSVYYYYDAYGRIIRASADTDNGVQTLSDYSYSSVFPLSAKTIQYSGAEAGDIETRVYTDGMGRTIHTIKSALSESGKMYTISGKVMYDELGRVIKMGQTDWAGDDEIDEFIEAAYIKNPTIYEYDASGRQRKITSPRAFDGEPETSVIYKYVDPWEVVSTHSIGQSKRTVKNARGQVLYVEDFGTGDLGNFVSAKIGFAYDIAGNRVKKMDLSSSYPPLTPEGGTEMNLFMPSPPAPLPEGEGSVDIPDKDQSGYNIAYWWFDAFGQLKASIDPDLGYSGFRYNGFGDVIKTADANNKVTTMSYDRLGRLIQKNLLGDPDNPDDDEGVVQYTYDSLEGSENTKGRLAKLVDPAQSKEFSYNKLGHRIREVRQYYDDASNPDLSKPFETTFSYDLLGRTTRIVYPKDPRLQSSISVDYAYNSMGLVNSVNTKYGPESTEKPVVKNIDYNEFGQMTRVINGNDVVTNYEYDVKGRLAHLSSLTENDGEINSLQDVEYSFKINNSIQSIVNKPTQTVEGESVKYLS